MSGEDFFDADLREKLTAFDEVAGEGTECPAPERLWEFARGKPDPAAAEPLVLHIAECTACASECRMARDLVEEPRSARANVRSNVFVRPWIPLAAAAVIVIAMVGFWQFRLSDRNETSPVLRTPGSDWIRPSIEESVPLPRDGFVLRWTAGPEGTTYDVLVTTEDLEPLGQAWRLERPEFRLETQALAGLSAGSPVLWQVTAYPPGGQRVVSPTFVTPIE